MFATCLSATEQHSQNNIRGNAIYWDHALVDIITMVGQRHNDQKGTILCIIPETLAIHVSIDALMWDGRTFLLPVRGLFSYVLIPIDHIDSVALQ